MEALLNELELRKNELEHQSLETIYFGGGTPSLLTKKELESILAIIYKNYQVTKNPEITIEANPDDLNSSYLK